MVHDQGGLRCATAICQNFCRELFNGIGDIGQYRRCHDYITARPVNLCHIDLLRAALHRWDVMGVIPAAFPHVIAQGSIGDVAAPIPPWLARIAPILGDGLIVGRGGCCGEGAARIAEAHANGGCGRVDRLDDEASSAAGGDT